MAMSPVVNFYMSLSILRNGSVALLNLRVKDPSREGTDYQEGIMCNAIRNVHLILPSKDEGCIFK